MNTTTASTLPANDTAETSAPETPALPKCSLLAAQIEAHCAELFTALGDSDPAMGKQIALALFRLAATRAFRTGSAETGYLSRFKVEAWATRAVVDSLKAIKDAAKASAAVAAPVEPENDAE